MLARFTADTAVPGTEDLLEAHRLVADLSGVPSSVSYGQSVTARSVLTDATLLSFCRPEPTVRGSLPCSDDHDRPGPGHHLGW